MKPKLNMLLILIATLLLTYLIFSFVRWDLDISSSSVDTRLVMVFVWITTTISGFFFFLTTSKI